MGWAELYDGIPLEPSDVPEKSILGKQDGNSKLDRIEPILSITVNGIQIEDDFKEWDRLAYHGWLIKRPNQAWTLCRKPRPKGVRATTDSVS